MSILLYCVCADAGVRNFTQGVAGFPVLSCAQGDLALLFSQGASPEDWTGTPLRESARQFHDVLRRTFESGAIIPFRFPTLLESEAELVAHMRDNTSSYTALLKKFRTYAQMEAVIGYSDDSRTVQRDLSGAEYLRARQKHSAGLEEVAAHLQERAGALVQEWRSRPIQNRIRIFALLDRGSVTNFNQKLCEMQVPDGMAVRVTGPWPVTEFLE